MGVVRQRLAVIRSAIGPSRPGRLGKMDIERLVGSIRRECINDVIVLGKVHLRKSLKLYAHYHNRLRTYLSLDKDAPIHRAARHAGTIVAIPMLGGLHHHCVRF